MPGTEHIVFAFGAAEEAADAVQLAKRREGIAAARQQFMRIRLMSDVPDNLIMRRIKDGMQRNR